MTDAQKGDWHTRQKIRDVRWAWVFGRPVSGILVVMPIQQWVREALTGPECVVSAVL